MCILMCVYKTVDSNFFTKTYIHNDVEFNVRTQTCGVQCVYTNLWSSMCVHKPVEFNVCTQTCGV